MNINNPMISLLFIQFKLTTRLCIFFQHPGYGALRQFILHINTGCYQIIHWLLLKTIATYLVLNCRPDKEIMNFNLGLFMLGWQYSIRVNRFMVNMRIVMLNSELRIQKWTVLLLGYSRSNFKHCNLAPQVPRKCV